MFLTFFFINFAFAQKISNAKLKKKVNEIVTGSKHDVHVRSLTICH